jgi:hypothetical protein
MPQTHGAGDTDLRQRRLLLAQAAGPGSIRYPPRHGWRCLPYRFTIQPFAYSLRTR